MVFAERGVVASQGLNCRAPLIVAEATCAREKRHAWQRTS